MNYSLVFISGEVARCEVCGVLVDPSIIYTDAHDEFHQAVSR